MPIFVYIISGIALLIGLLLFSKIRLFVCYDESLRVYARLWFIRYDIIPARAKIPKKEKPKKGAPKKAPVPKAPAPAPAKEKKEKSTVSKLWEIKEVILSIVSKAMGKLVFKFIKLKIIIGGENACATALLYGGVSQGVAYLVEALDNISKVKVENSSDIVIESDFIGQKSEFECKIELYMRVISIISVGIHALKEYIKSRTED